MRVWKILAGEWSLVIVFTFVANYVLLDKLKNDFTKKNYSQNVLEILFDSKYWLKVTAIVQQIFVYDNLEKL